MSSEAGLLILESKTSSGFREWEGSLFGALITADQILSRKEKDRGFGEMVFNTSLTGYQEILTDPSYFGQIVCMTNPHIGNTGINEEDMESRKPWVGGFVVHALSTQSSNWRAQGELEPFLKNNEIPGISGIDTRALTRHLRSQGVTRALILKQSERGRAEELFSKLPVFDGRDMIREVSTLGAYTWPRNDSEKTRKGTYPFQVVALDFGIKWNLLRSLEAVGCQVKVLPANASPDQILKENPHGLFLSNGPGDPAAAPYATETVRDLLGKLPIMGVCMGHQILALALGAKTYKLKFGHRGGNQPVLDQLTKRVEISSHNHGFAVDPRTLPDLAQVSHLNLNDQCMEGLRAPTLKAFSVQYHPESSPGPHDSFHLFDEFVNLMKSHATALS